MMTFGEKLRELVIAADTDSAHAQALDDTAVAYLDQFNQWPLETLVPLSRVAEVMAALLIEPNVSIRRLRATDGVQMRDYLG